jgi:hypothetical protein
MEEDIEKSVYEYIVKHGGEIDVGECERELKIPREKIRGAIDNLMRKGTLMAERPPEAPKKPPAPPVAKPPEKAVKRGVPKPAVALVIGGLVVGLAIIYLFPQALFPQAEPEQPPSPPTLAGRLFHMDHYVEYEFPAFNYTRVLTGDENEGDRLLDYLGNTFNVGWVEEAEIENIGDEIRVVSGNNSIQIQLSDDRTRATVRLNDLEHELIVREEDGELNTYEKREGKIVDIRPLENEEKWEYEVEFYRRNAEGAWVRTETIWILEEELTRAPDFTLTVSPDANSLEQGKTIPVLVKVGSVKGYAENVVLSFSGFPSGVEATLNPVSGIVPFDSTLQVKADADAPLKWELTEVPIRGDEVDGGANVPRTHTFVYSVRVIEPQGYGWNLFERQTPGMRA